MAWMIRLTLFLLLDLKLLEVTAQQTACFPDFRDTNGEEQCLSLIRQKALDTSGFSTVCLPEPSDADGCWIEGHFPNQPNSLSMWAFGVLCPLEPLSGLDRYLGVHYTSPPGSYIGCDSRYETQDMIDFELDPLTDLSVDSWVTRQVPRFSWRAQRNELFTLMFVNFDRNILHMALANIRGNDTEDALQLIPYDGTHVRWYDPLVYGFLLYKQQEPFESDIQLQISNFTDFAQKHALQGPVGVNWMIVNADPGSVEITNAFHTQQYCPLLTQKELEKNNPELPYLAQPYDLKVHLRVRFTTDRFTYKCGPLSITHPGSDFFLDPIGNPILNVADIRTESTQTISMQMYKTFPDNEIDFAGKLYTLLIVDEQFPFLHGLTINIHGDDVTSGMVIQVYRQPLPPSVHTYYYLLYEQKTEINPAATAGFTQTTCPSNRCLHGVIQAFISVNDLELVGATWMRAEQDNYVQCMRLQ